MEEYNEYEGEAETGYFNGGGTCEEDSDCWSPSQCYNGECVRYYCTVQYHCPSTLPLCHVVEYSYGGWGFCGTCVNNYNCENGEVCNYLNMCEEENEYEEDAVLIQQGATLRAKTQTKSKSKSKSHHHHQHEEEFTLAPFRGNPADYQRAYGANFARASSAAQAMMMTRITPVIVAAQMNN